MDLLNLAIPFLTSLLMGMGVGGGGLLTVYFTVISGMEQGQAQGLNLLSYAIACSAAAFIHLKKKNINRKKVAYLGLCTCLGSVLGALVAQRISSGVLSVSFSVFIILLGIYGLIKGLKKDVHA